MTGKSIKISEYFFSIQGEGKTVGKPSMFIRLPGCNLLCDGKWRCDTIEVWRKFKKVEPPTLLEFIHDKGVRNIIFTGGEPLLQPKVILDLVDYFPKDITYEVETNGTIEPQEDFCDVVTEWNVSPKLANSGMSKANRIKPKVLELFSAIRANFKFVVSNSNDIKEIKKDFPMVPRELIWLMPACSSREEHNKVSPAVAELAKQNGYNFSPRLQLLIWDKAVGV